MRTAVTSWARYAPTAWRTECFSGTFLAQDELAALLPQQCELLVSAASLLKLTSSLSKTLSCCLTSPLVLPQAPECSAHPLLHAHEQGRQSAAAASACCQAHATSQLLPHASRSPEAAAHLSSGLLSLLALLIIASQDNGSCRAGLIGQGVIIVKHLLEGVTC